MSDTKARLIRFFEKYNPSNIANVDKVLAAYAGKEDQLFDALVKKYGPEPASGAAASPPSSPRAAAAGGNDTKARLTRFFEKYNPANVANVDKVAASYAGKEDQLWAALTKKYGPEPGASDSGAAASPPSSPRAAGGNDTKSRLTRFFQKYNPSNVANIDKVMASYAGKEDQLWAALTQKYGPEPPADQTSGATSPAAASSPSSSAPNSARGPGGGDTKERLVRFFQKYNPQNIANVDKVMASYAGKEDQLFAALTKKYGPEPGAAEMSSNPSAGNSAATSPASSAPNSARGLGGSDTKSRLIRFFQKYNPGNVANVDKVLAAYAGKEEQLWASLTQKYGPEPPADDGNAAGAGDNTPPPTAQGGAAPPAMDTKSRLTRFFQKYNPANVANIDKVMAAYAGKEDALWASLIQKYGPEPPADGGDASRSTSGATATTTSSAPAMDTKSRLTRFFQKYNPANVANIDKVMAAYAGKEDALWASLVQKYGPEPEVTPDGSRSVSGASAGAPPAMDTKSRLTRFFQKYNPANVANIDKVMAAYTGREDALWASLVQKYGPEPVVEQQQGSAGAAVDVPMDTKSRLTRFFQKYNPANVANIDKVMAAYAGKEDALWASLVQKYGPEPTPASSRSASAAPPAMDTKSRLTRFFQKYNPANVANIDKVMAAYAGKEDALWASLVQKYGPEPAVDSTSGAASTVGTPTASNGPTPQSSRSVSAAATPRAGPASSEHLYFQMASDGTLRPPQKALEDQLEMMDVLDIIAQLPMATVIQQLQAQGGPLSKEDDSYWQDFLKSASSAPAPAPGQQQRQQQAPSASGSAPAMDTKSRLTRFFQKYNPANVANIDKVMAAYAGKENALWASLIQKYGPEPAVAQQQQQAAAPSPTANAAAAPAMDTKSRLTRFFQKYNPANVANIDKVMAAYAGKEDQLWASLIQKYGPEPAVQQSAAPAPQGDAAPPAMDTKSRLTRFFQKYNPANVANIDKVMAAYADKEDALWASLVQKYGPEPAVAQQQQASTSSAAPAPAMDTKSRLTRFFQKYNPANVANIDKVMAAYAGKEDQLWASLIQKYGPEPAVQQAAAAPAAQGGAAPAMDTKSRLTRFFQKYNPANVANIDKVMAAYAGKEDALWASLIQKYGPEPPADGGDASRSTSGATATTTSSAPAMDTKSRLTRFFQKYNPANVANIDKVMAAYAGKEDALWASLVQKYGPEPPAEGGDNSRSTSGVSASTASSVPMDTKSRLTRFFQKYNPANVANIDKVMAAYAGKEDALWASLVQKYGPEPEVTPASSRSASAASTAVPMDTKSRLVRFFQKYNPQNVANVDKVLAAYAGKEDALWASLVQKYGPEPEATPASSRSISQVSTAPTDSRSGSMNNNTQQPQTQQHTSSAAAAPKTPAEIAKYKGHIAKHLTQKKVDPSTFLIKSLGSEQATQQFIASTYHPDESIEGRVSRIISKHYPEKLLEKVVFEECVHAVKEAEGDTRVLVQGFGGEPIVSIPKALASVPISTINKVDFFELEKEMFAANAPMDSSLRRQRHAPAASPAFLRHNNFDMKFAEDEAAETGTRQLVDVAEELAEGTKITDDARDTEAGQVEDEADKTYPQEDEFWCRLSFRDAGVGVIQNRGQQQRGRSYTEFQGGAGGNNTPGTESAVSPKSGGNTPAQTPRQQKLVAVEIEDSAGDTLTNEKALCTNCSVGIQRSFRALWTSVGARHRQMLNTSQMKTGWIEKLTSGRFRSTFQSRYFKVNDKGLHYFLNDTDPNEKAKGHKHFTEQSTVISSPGQDRFPQATDGDGYHYFAVTVNLNNEPYLLRVDDRKKKEEWVTFMKEAIERLKLTTMVGQDPNPGRWRARYAGIREVQANETQKTASIVERCELAAKERDLLRLDLNELKTEVTVDEQQIEDLKEQAKVLRSKIDKANFEHKQKVQDLERAKVDAEREKKELDHRTVELEDEQKSSMSVTESVRSELIRIRLQIADESDKQQNLHVKLKKLEAKRRQAEERRPTTMVSRALNNSGLAYRPPGAAPLHSSHLSAMELQRTKEAREKIVDKLVEDARTRKEKARIRMDHAAKVQAAKTPQKQKEEEEEAKKEQKEKDKKEKKEAKEGEEKKEGDAAAQAEEKKEGEAETKKEGDAAEAKKEEPAAEKKEE